MTTIAAGKAIGVGAAAGFTMVCLLVGLLQKHDLLPDGYQSPEETFWMSLMGMLSVLWAMTSRM